MNLLGGFSVAGGGMLPQLASTIAAAAVSYTMFQHYFPPELAGIIRRYTEKLIAFFNPYIQITFPEYTGDSFERSRAFVDIERYLNSAAIAQAKRLQASVEKDSENVVFSMANCEEVEDYFQGIKIWWNSRITTVSSNRTFSWRSRGQEMEKKSFNLWFHKKHKEIMTTKYLKYVLKEGKEIAVRERRRKLYTNSGDNDWFSFLENHRVWGHVLFNHPSTFETLAMDPEKKQELINDLINFAKSESYYVRIGKAWKRGYLLYGPPGTGKSSIIAAMANLLEYDVYDLELTSVKDNTELRKLLIDTSSKSILVIEDIDCSLDITGDREKKKKKKKKKEEDSKKKKKKKKEHSMNRRGDDDKSKVTLSGLLNIIDGLWSACGGERIIVFTTNHIEKLDPALIRRGRMDKHIELSYCGYEAFRILAKNYLGIELSSSHKLFPRIRTLLEETEMTPADVAENLMRKNSDDDQESCLLRLIEALEESKIKAEEENKRKAEEAANKKEEETDEEEESEETEEEED